MNMINQQQMTMEQMNMPMNEGRMQQSRYWKWEENWNISLMKYSFLSTRVIWVGKEMTCVVMYSHDYYPPSWWLLRLPIVRFSCVGFCSWTVLFIFTCCVENVQFWTFVYRLICLVVVWFSKLNLFIRGNRLSCKRTFQYTQIPAGKGSWTRMCLFPPKLNRWLEEWLSTVFSVVVSWIWVDLWVPSR